MNHLNIAYRLAISCYLLQFALLGAGTFLSPNAQTDSLYNIAIGLALTLIKGIPWLVLIPGLLQKSKNVMAWMSYICLVYFIIWVLAAFGQNQHQLATWGVVVTLVQFVAAGYHTRLAKRQ